MNTPLLQRTVYAKIGELIQGKVSADAAFLIANQCANHFYTTTVLLKTASSAIVLNEKAYRALLLFLLVSEGRSLTTLKQATIKTLEQENYNKLQHCFYNITIVQESTIAKGKGLSSSSADILSVLLAVNQYLNTGMSDEQLYTIAATVDPTDPCLSPELVVFDQKNGCVLEQLPLMNYHLIYFDSDIKTTVDTVMLSETANYSEEEYTHYALLLKEFEQAIHQQSYSDFFKLTRKSALLNQKRLIHFKMELLLEFSELHETGMFIAHSGTYMGLLLKPDQRLTLQEKAIHFIQQNWNTVVYYQ